jgi:hypothetical protein
MRVVSNAGDIKQVKKNNNASLFNTLEGQQGADKLLENNLPFFCIYLLYT